MQDLFIGSHLHCIYSQQQTYVFCLLIDGFQYFYTHFYTPFIIGSFPYHGCPTWGSPAVAELQISGGTWLLCTKCIISLPCLMALNMEKGWGIPLIWSSIQVFFFQFWTGWEGFCVIAGGNFPSPPFCPTGSDLRVLLPSGQREKSILRCSNKILNQVLSFEWSFTFNNRSSFFAGAF